MTSLSRTRAASASLLLCGTTIVALILITFPQAKIAIPGSAFGLLLILAGVHLTSGEENISSLTLPRPWVQYFPLVLASSVDIAGDLIPPIISAFAFAAALTLLFYMCKAKISKAYITFLMIFLAGSIGYNLFFHFPILSSPQGTDVWGYIAIAAAIVRTGHFSNLALPINVIDLYYFPFPVMSIAPAMLSSIAGFDLQTSLLIFPGSLILLQPLITFLLARVVYDNPEAAAFSAFVVLTESVVIHYLAAPFAESVSVSLLLLFLVIVLSRKVSMVRATVAFVLFLLLTIVHGFIGLLSIVLAPYVMRKRSPYKALTRVFPLILAAYLLMASLFYGLTYRIATEAQKVIESLFVPSITGVEASYSAGSVSSVVYSPGSAGVIFIWWGFPASLALFFILVQGRKQACSFEYAGLSLLGISFILNFLAPSFGYDRYVSVVAWLLLAVAGGRTLTSLTRTKRRLLLIAPIIFLVCLSAVVTPTTSPQYGFRVHQQPAVTSYVGLPLAKSDMIALDWVNGHAPGWVITDVTSITYLIFARYRSGVFSSDRIVSGFASYHALVFPRSESDTVSFFRWWNVRISGEGQACNGLISDLTNQQTSQIVDVLYDNSCDVVMGG